MKIGLKNNNYCNLQVYKQFNIVRFFISVKKLSISRQYNFQYSRGFFIRKPLKIINFFDFKKMR